MAVDRHARDAVADILAAFLRCDADRQATIEKLIYWQDHNAVDDAYVKSLLDSLMHGLSVFASDQRWWDDLRRDLAFLQTDLEKRELPPLPPGPADTLPFVYWHLLALATALAISWFVGWWPFIGVWAAAGLFGMVHAQFQDYRTPRYTEWSRLVAYLPFRDEEEWMAHAKLLERFQLATYEMWQQKNEPSALMNAASNVVFWIVVPAILAFMFACSVAFWPLFVVAFSISELFPKKDNQSLPT